MQRTALLIEYCTLVRRVRTKLTAQFVGLGDNKVCVSKRLGRILWIYFKAVLDIDAVWREWLVLDEGKLGTQPTLAEQLGTTESLKAEHRLLFFVKLLVPIPAIP